MTDDEAQAVGRRNPVVVRDGIWIALKGGEVVASSEGTPHGVFQVLHRDGIKGAVTKYVPRGDAVSDAECSPA